MIEINESYQDITNTDKRYIIVTGGRGCFHGDQLVVTNNGTKQIKDILIGDFVKSYNHKKECFEFKEVLNVFEYDNEEIIKIKLKNGTVINVTENHKFFYKGEYICIKHLLSLWYGRDMENNTNTTR